MFIYFLFLYFHQGCSDALVEILGKHKTQTILICVGIAMAVLEVSPNRQLAPNLIYPQVRANGIRRHQGDISNYPLPSLFI